MFCKRCGTKLSEGTKFCPKCGTKVSNAQTATRENLQKRMIEDLEKIDAIKAVRNTTVKTIKIIKINQVKIDEMLLLPGINLSEAQSIINQRERLGGFVTKDEFMDFLPTIGVQPHHYVAIEPLVVIEPLIVENARVIDF